MGLSQFDPSTIPPFSVIRVPYQFDGSPDVQSKLFVVLGHLEGVAFCIKTTSKKSNYTDRRRRMGVVCFEAGEVACFDLETYIEPDNQFPIKHYDILRAHQNGKLEIHKLPTDFPDRLMAAIDASITISPREKSRLSKYLSK